MRTLDFIHEPTGLGPEQHARNVAATIEVATHPQKHRDWNLVGGVVVPLPRVPLTLAEAESLAQAAPTPGNLARLREAAATANEAAMAQRQGEE